MHWPEKNNPLLRIAIAAFIFLFLVIIAPNASKAYAPPSDIKLLSDISYGEDADQTLDVYIPADAKDAPVIFMIHGGGWTGGDKANKAVVENKVAHWVTRGFVLISTNYRTLPKIGPIGQAKDVEAALLFSQAKIGEWGGAADKFILMGHSSGAHLVSLLSSKYDTITTGTENRITPWLATVSLDISLYDVVKIMSAENPHEHFKRVFGDDPDYWEEASPTFALTEEIPPFLAVCREGSDISCIESQSFISKAKSLGTYVELLPIDLSHREINSELGKDSCYTNKVDDFLRKLSPGIASMLSSRGTRTQKDSAGD